jgi:hypothetical protein
LLFLINPSTLGRSLQFLFFWFCSWLSGRKNRPLMTVLVIAGIVLVNLLVPYGRVLAEFGPLHITAGSLMDGLRKGITLEGLIMLSATVIRGRPPSGTPVVSTAGSGHGIAALFHSAVFKRIAVFGRFLGESLSIVAILHEGRGRIRPGHFIDDVDALLLEIGESSAGVEVEKTEGGKNQVAEQFPSPAPGRLWLVVGLLITASLLTLPLLLSHVRG